MACKHCGLSDNSPSILADIGSLSMTSSGELWEIVQSFDTEISRVETLLNGLVLKRALLKRKINHHSSPLLRIPSDITSEIFKAYLNKDGETEGRVTWRGEFDSEGALLSPLLFGGVCSEWRELAWSIPWVWNSIAVEVKTPFPNRANLLAEWLSRSGQCALIISLRCNVDFHEKTARDSMEEVIGVISRFSERWRHITFDLPSICYDTLSSIQGHVPLLESMSVRLQGGIRHNEGPFQMFSVAPQLKVVHCSDFPPQSIMIPLAQLTSLTGYECNVMDCLKVLCIAPQLTYASFDVKISFETSASLSPSYPRQVLAPCIQSLQLDFYGDISTLLDNLNLPDVRDLWFRGNGGSIEFFSQASFSSFISRSACPLQYLSFINIPLNDDDLLQCMQVSPSLEMLLIQGSNNITDQTIRNLTPNITSNLPLLPNLRELSISSGGLLINAFELYTMLSARWGRGDAGPSHGVARLQSVRISAVGRRDETEQRRLSLLDELSAEGMDIFLVS